MSTINSRTFAGTGGLPRRDFQRQNKPKPLRCHPNRVSGLTIIKAFFSHRSAPTPPNSAERHRLVAAVESGALDRKPVVCGGRDSRLASPRAIRARKSSTSADRRNKSTGERKSLVGFAWKRNSSRQRGSQYEKCDSCASGCRCERCSFTVGYGSGSVFAQHNGRKGHRRPFADP